MIRKVIQETTDRVQIFIILVIGMIAIIILEFWVAKNWVDLKDFIEATQGEPRVAFKMFIL